MVVDRSSARARELSPDATTPAAVWHDLECGTYRADRAVWLGLAAGAQRRAPTWRSDEGRRESARILDVGAGTGRVACELARAGHRVTALDLDQDLLDTLTVRAQGLEIETVCADARSFSLPRRDFDACFIPMQTIQLLGGPEERMGFLRSARAHLRADGTLACAIVTKVEPFDADAGGPAPAPDMGRFRSSLYVSRPTRVAVRGGRVVIERERHVAALGEDASGRPDEIERDLSVLTELNAAELQREGAQAGFRPWEVLAIAPTAEHVGSQVVVFRA
jgi:SAM-dependent methyltransferase